MFTAVKTAHGYGVRIDTAAGPVVAADIAPDRQAAQRFAARLNQYGATVDDLLAAAAPPQEEAQWGRR